MILLSMTEKRCPKCKKIKDIEDFGLKKSSKDGRQAYCKECRNAYLKEWYKDNKVLHGKRVRQAEAKRSAKIYEEIRKLKSVPCPDCDRTYDPVCMDFDHLPGNVKLYNIANMVKDKLPLSKILEEIAKCEVVCVNCHRLRTKNRKNVAE